MMHTATIVWIDARDTVPINKRLVLIVHANNWLVDVGCYATTWTSHGEPAKVKYWADFPDAPPPPDYS